MPQKRKAARKFRREGELTSDQVIAHLMCAGWGNYSEAEIEQLRAALCGDAAGRASFDGWLASHEAWLRRPPEPILSDEDGARILGEPLAHAEHVPAGFRAWTLKQPDGAQLWRDWLESIRQAQIEKRTTNV